LSPRREYNPDYENLKKAIKMMKAKILHLFTVMMLALLAVGDLAYAATITWTNTSGGNWSANNNWSPHQVPTNTNDGLTTNAAICTVTLDVSGVVANLTLVAGDGAGGVQRFASNADSYCTSIAET
jgi:hypothetical protein